MFFRQLDVALNSGLLAKMGGVLARSSLRRILARFEPCKHNGAPLLGLRSVVVKSHGNASQEAMTHAIIEAIEEARQQVPQQIELMIQDYSI
jgi:glycerol-3-phosphate acyltransferase PlsX